MPAMAETLHKFPSTPHLAWLGGADVRDDKVLTPSEVEQFLSGPVVVEEKVDGANLGLSFGVEGQLRFQNRGNWLEGKLTGQWERLRAWAAEHEASLGSVLPGNHILFGEWCYAAHSIHYDRLPDWFLAFDVYDVAARGFWDVERRNALASAAHLATVAEVSRGVFTKAEIIATLDGPSTWAAGPREGLYLRQEEGGWLLSRAKVVRPEFIQTITGHWSRRKIVPNETTGALAPAAS
jgi:hypothetical protein